MHLFSDELSPQKYWLGPKSQFVCVCVCVCKYERERERERESECVRACVFKHRCSSKIIALTALKHPLLFTPTDHAAETKEAGKVQVQASRRCYSL